LNFGGADPGGDGGVTIDGVYYAGGFQYDPYNPMNGHCYTDPCDKEAGGQNLVGELSRTSEPYTFDLLGFYFNLQGAGGKAINFLTVAAFDGDVLRGSVDFVLGSLLSGYSNDYSLVRVNEGAGQCDYAVYICDVTGYSVSIFSSLFEGVTSVRFIASENANARIDDLSMSVVPLPAGGLLLLSALGGLGLVRPRKRKAALA
jgi:hypothetical protein